MNVSPNPRCPPLMLMAFFCGGYAIKNETAVPTVQKLDDDELTLEFAGSRFIIPTVECLFASVGANVDQAASVNVDNQALPGVGRGKL